MRHNAEELLERLEPAQRRLLAVVQALAATPPARVYLVGGPVRDLLMGRTAHDLDFVVEGDGPAFAARLAERLGGSLRVFERFGTAVVGSRGVGHVDVTSARSEQYPQPGALPEVERPAPLERDLRRRDFTINALAIAVGPEAAGRMYDPLHGQQDLQARVLRIVHERSFLDDPNRLIRAAAFAGRLGFALEPGTERRLREAAASGALGTISADRRNDTLRRLLEKPGAPRALELLGEWGLLEQVGLEGDGSQESEVESRERETAPTLSPRRRRRDSPPLAGESLESLTSVPEGLEALGELATGRGAARAYMDLLLARPGVDVEAGMTALGLGRKPRAEVRRAVAALREPPAVLGRGRGSEADLYLALEELDRGALAALWTGAGPAGRERLARYWRRLRHVQPDLTGEDLAERGRSGPEIAAGLRRALLLKLDQPQATREQQLRAALATHRNHEHH